MLSLLRLLELDGDDGTVLLGILLCIYGSSFAMEMQSVCKLEPFRKGVILV